MVSPGSTTALTCAGQTNPYAAATMMIYVLHLTTHDDFVPHQEDVAMEEVLEVAAEAGAETLSSFMHSSKTMLRPRTHSRMMSLPTIPTSRTMWI